MVFFVYGLIQLLISFHKLQGAIDAFRTKQRFWYLRAVSACITLIFGLMIVLNPNMTFMSIWVFTGATLLIEGVLDDVSLALQQQNTHTGGCQIKKYAANLITSVRVFLSPLPLWRQSSCKAE